MRHQGLWVLAGAVLGVSCAAAAAQPGEPPLPRSLTPAERAYLAEHPLVPERSGGAPTGPLWCPPEYAPCEAIFVAWEGSTAWKNILAQMGARITTTGDADLIVGVDSTAVRTSATNTLTNAGADMARVRFIVRAFDTIWIRDYGPRFAYENGVRVVVDHTYNRPRPNDNAFNDAFCTLDNIPQYDIPLVHGGGNYHLSGLGDAYATRLIANENPGLTEQEIIDLWQQYQGVLTALQTPFRQSVDSTQHIDMWTIPVADREIIVSDWPLSPGSYEDNICDSFAAMMQAAGYTVHRVPAVFTGGTHYTYTNAVICNGLVCIPSYTNGTVSPYNAQALATWQAANPGKTVVQIPCQSIITSAGALHCIAMHMPAAAGGTDPTVYLRSLNEQGLTLQPGDQVELEWISDDDVDTYYIKLELSLDGGATWPIIISAFEADDGTYAWTVPDVATAHARVKAIVYDYMEATGEDANDFDFTIGEPCPADFDGDGGVTTLDVLAFLNAWNAGDSRADFNDDGSFNTLDVLAFLNAWNEGC